MNFGLLLSQLPRVDESHTHYDAMLELQEREPRFAALVVSPAHRYAGDTSVVRWLRVYFLRTAAPFR